MDILQGEHLRKEELAGIVDQRITICLVVLIQGRKKVMWLSVGTVERKGTYHRNFLNLPSLGC
jgi:hypothetical protein